MIDHPYQGHRRLGEIVWIGRSSVMRGIKEKIYIVECNTDEFQKKKRSVT